MIQNKLFTCKKILKSSVPIRFFSFVKIISTTWQYNCVLNSVKQLIILLKFGSSSESSTYNLFSSLLDSDFFEIKINFYL